MAHAEPTQKDDNKDMNNADYSPENYKPESKAVRDERNRAKMAAYHSGATLRTVLAQGQKAGK